MPCVAMRCDALARSRSMDGTEKWRFGLLVVAVVAVQAGVAFGQVRTGRDIYDEQLRVRLDQQLPEAREMGFDAGGWFSMAYFNYDDASTSSGRIRSSLALVGDTEGDDWNAELNPPMDTAFTLRTSNGTIRIEGTGS